MEKLTAASKESIAVARNHYRDWMGSIPDNQLSTGYYLQSVGNRYLTVLNTWDGSKIEKWNLLKLGEDMEMECNG